MGIMIDDERRERKFALPTLYCHHPVPYPYMQRLRIILIWSFLGILICFSAGMYAGYKVFTPKAKMETRISTQAILTALHDRGFLVSQTYVFDTPVTIDRSSGNAFKDFFFGQTIEARGTMEVNLGIDLADVKAEDVTVNEAANTVIVRIPKAKLFNARLVGPIELKNKQGVLKKLLDSDDGYNESLSLLSKTAEEMAQRPEIIARADESAKDDLVRMLGYVAEGKTVQVEGK